MNYAVALATVACDSCGDIQPAHEMFELRYELVCAGCKADHDTKTHAAAVADFRWQSANWFQTSHIERMPFMSRLQFGGY